MCKMVYRVRTTVAYFQGTLVGEESLNKMKELYREDDTFATMIKIVRTCLLNLFQGTHDQPVYNGHDDSPTKSIYEAKKAKGQNDLELKREDFFLTETPAHMNGYDKVHDLIPQHTDIMHAIIGCIASFDILTDPKLDENIHKAEVVYKQITQRAKEREEQEQRTGSAQHDKREKKGNSLLVPDFNRKGPRKTVMPGLKALKGLTVTNIDKGKKIKAEFTKKLRGKNAKSKNNDLLGFTEDK